MLFFFSKQELIIWDSVPNMLNFGLGYSSPLMMMKHNSTISILYNLNNTLMSEQLNINGSITTIPIFLWKIQILLILFNGLTWIRLTSTYTVDAQSYTLFIWYSVKWCSVVITICQLNINGWVYRLIQQLKGIAPPTQNYHVLCSISK